MKSSEVDHLDRIAQLILEGKVALFIGNGASQAAGIPSTADIVASIKSKFPKAKYRTNDFMDICQAIVDSDFYDGRKELEDHIRSILLKVQPSKWHLQLPNCKWRAIFTTNFDDLIEQSFRLNPTTGSDFHTVLTDDFSVADRSTLRIFKLMGTVLARGNDPGRMVLCNDDYVRNVKMRSKVASLMYDIILDGTLVFVGYSGDDQLVLEIMGEVMEQRPEGPSKSYILLKDLSSIEGERQKFSKKGIIPIELSFEQLMNFLSTKPSITRPKVGEEELIKVEGYDVRFAPAELAPYKKLFRLLNEENPQGDPGIRMTFSEVSMKAGEPTRRTGTLNEMFTQKKAELGNESKQSWQKRTLMKTTS